jgi:splicing factor 3A subunit 1
MATTANGDGSAVLDGMKPPSGVVLPPRELRTVAEKTAGYVERNGAAFENRIREKELQNPKFSFLDPGDAYHAYYLWRLDEIRAGRGTDIAAGRVGDAAGPVAQKPKGPPKPPEFQFSAKMPRMNQKDLEVIRLTALFVARNGRQWQTQLAQREAGNAQFQFLSPSHTFYTFYQHLVDQYTTLIRTSGLAGEEGKLRRERTAELEKNVENKWHVLTRAKQRAAYAKFEEAEKLKREEDEEQKKVEFERTDWGDFVVVETITFTDGDDTANLPPPTTLSDLQYASLEEKNKMSISANMRIEEAMPTDDEPTLNYGAQPSFPLPVHTGYAPQPIPPQPHHYHAPAPPSMPAYPSAPAPERQLSAQEEEEERRIQERTEARQRMHQAQAVALGGAPMKIKEDYVPRAAQRAANKQAGQGLCPNCKQMIPLNELEEHMRSKLIPYPPLSRTDADYVS